MTPPRVRAAGSGDRRRHRRLEAERQLILISVASRIDGVMQDLSRHGARVVMREVPPRNGRDVLLRWGPHEVFGHVVWSSGGDAGIAFHKPMPADVLVDTVDEGGAEPGATGWKVL